MDKKYIIDLDSNGLINYVGINTPEGLVIKKITDKEDATEYMKQMREIDKEYGFFFRSYFNRQCDIASTRFFESEMRKQYVKEEPAPVITEKVNNKSIKQVAALALAFIIGASGMALAKEGNIAAKAKKVLGFNKQTTIQASEKTKKTKEAKKTKEENLANKSLDELIAMLDKNGQQQAFNKIIDTQDYFNEVAAPTVKQGDKQLYFTFDETTSAYLYANAKAVNSDKLSSFFGKSKILLLNNNGEYEELNNEGVAANYLSFCLNLSYYYQLGATETSGVSQIFENEEEAKFFNEFESKILEYNKNKNETTKAEIRQMLERIYMSGSIDSEMEKYSGASSIIGTAIVPYLYLEGIIDEDMYNSLVEINETLTCQDIYSQIGKAINCKIKANGKEAIIEEIVKRQNATIKNLNRNLDMSEAIDGYSLGGLSLGDIIGGYASGYSNSRTITKHVETTTKNRSEAVSKTSEKQVKQAEKEANESIEKKNAAEDERARKLVEDNKKKDQEQAKEQKRKYDEEHKNDKPKEVVIEETWVPEETPQNHDDKEDVQPEPQVVEEIIEDTHIYGEPQTNNSTDYNNNSSENSSSSSSSSEPQVVEEIIEDTHIYGEAPKAQKVVSIERYEETNETVETQEVVEEANVRVRQ